jgi:hypothetical protein
MSSNYSRRARGLTLVGVLILSGLSFYSAYDAISTGVTKSPGRNNNRYVLRSEEPHVFRSLVSIDIGAGVIFAVVGVVCYVFGGYRKTPLEDGDRREL